MPTNELKLLLSVGHDRVRQTVEFARRWCVNRYETLRAFLDLPFSFILLSHDRPAFLPSTILTALDRSSISVSRQDSTKTGFSFGSRSEDREQSRTKSHATSATRPDSREPAAAGLIEYQGTINALRGNIDTLAQILQYIVTT